LIRPRKIKVGVQKALFYLLFSLFLIDVFLSASLLLHDYYLPLPLTNATFNIYLALVLVPAISVIGLYKRTFSNGSWVKWILLTLSITVVVGLFLLVIGPPLTYYSLVSCSNALRSGTHIHYSCTCQQLIFPYEVPQYNCAMDGYVFSPFFRITVQPLHFKITP
jgi:hypothetical protein